MENYFNYFTEIEERFQHCRGTRTLLSPLDWALIESWKEQGLPLEAVLAGIERAFEKFRARPQRFRRVNSLAYCSQEVLRAASEANVAAIQSGATKASERPVPPPFSAEEIRSFLERNADAIARASERAGETGQPVLAPDLASLAASLRELATQRSNTPTDDLEELERHLTAFEEKLTASLTRAAPAELSARLHEEIDHSLVPYRRKMTAVQIESLQRQFLKKRLLEHYEIPRLSLFYL